MASPVYSVEITTIFKGDTPDPSQAYGVLHSNGVEVPWPEGLTSISISNVGTIISITTIKKDLWTGGINAHVTATGTFGQPYSGGVAATWPAASTGIVAGMTTSSTTPSPISASSSQTTTTSPTSQTTTTSPTSETSGTTTHVETNTRSGTGELPVSTTSQSSTVSSPSSGISTGAIAGIAIGCALAGLLIGLLAAVCFFRRKGKPRNTVDTVVPHHELEAYPTDKVTPVHDIQLSQFLLEATPDRDIAQETQSIGALIDQHVESYYHTHPISINAEALESVLMQLGFPLTTNLVSSLDAQAAATLCLDPRSRRVGLRHVIMRVLFSSIDVYSPHGLSMLPGPVTSFLRAIPPTESDRFGDPEGMPCAPKTSESPFFILTKYFITSQRTSSSEVAQSISISSPSSSKPAEPSANRRRHGCPTSPGAGRLAQRIPALLCGPAPAASAAGGPSAGGD